MLVYSAVVSRRDVLPATIVGSFSAAFVILVLLGAFFPRVPRRELDCIGTPIAVSAWYQLRSLVPHSCAPQCEDREFHYLLYRNGLATQCEALPACRDLDEDFGVTCRLPQTETR